MPIIRQPVDEGASGGEVVAGAGAVAQLQIVLRQVAAKAERPRWTFDRLRMRGVAVEGLWPYPLLILSLSKDTG
jgi:hypothetical protein